MNDLYWIINFSNATGGGVAFVKVTQPKAEVEELFTRTHKLCEIGDNCKYPEVVCHECDNLGVSLLGFDYSFEEAEVIGVISESYINLEKLRMCEEKGLTIYYNGGDCC